MAGLARAELTANVSPERVDPVPEFEFDQAVSLSLPSRPITGLPTRTIDPGREALCRRLAAAIATGPFAALNTLEFRLTILGNVAFPMVIA